MLGAGAGADTQEQQIQSEPPQHRLSEVGRMLLHRSRVRAPVPFISDCISADNSVSRTRTIKVI